MTDLRRFLERSAAGFQPPDDWFQRIQDRRRRKRRNERLAATVVGMLVCGLILAGMTTLTGDPRLPPAAEPTPPAAEPTPTAAPLFRQIYRDTFTPGQNGWRRWPTVRRATHAFGYVGGAYEMRVRNPFENRYWIRRVLDPFPDVAVSVRIDREATGAAGWAGVMCPYSFSPDDGYAFVLAGSGGGWRILSVAEGQSPRILGEGSMAGMAPGDVTAVVVHGVCELLGSGRARLTIQVADEASSVIDEGGPDGFVGVGMYVQAEAGRAIARFDDLQLEAGDRCDPGHYLLLRDSSSLGPRSPVRSVTCTQ